MCCTISNNNYNKNCLFYILLTQLFVILITPEIFKHATSHKADWILTASSPALSCLFIYARLQPAERSQSRRFAFSPFRELYRDRLYICILILGCPFFPYGCCYWFARSMDFLVCIWACVLHTHSCCVIVIYFLHAHGLCSCSFWLLFSWEIILGRFVLRNNIFVIIFK